jgi:hypothetical protein
MTRPEPREAIEIEFKGRRYSGSFTTSIGMIHVISLHGRKSAQLDGAPPASLARTILMEIVNEAHKDGALK